jgi:uncharacterized integral membrane protein
MQIWFIVSLIFSLIVAAFAVLNSEVVTIKLFWANYELSQSVVIIISAALGAFVAFFLSLFSKLKSTLKIRELTNNLKNAEKKNELLSNAVKTHEQKASDNSAFRASQIKAGNSSDYASGQTATIDNTSPDSDQTDPSEE